MDNKKNEKFTKEIEEIINFKFLNVINGYNPIQVDKKIDQLIKIIHEILNENNKMKNEIISLEKKLLENNNNLSKDDKKN